jgi:hypothetical protein
VREQRKQTHPQDFPKWYLLLQLQQLDALDEVGEVLFAVRKAQPEIRLVGVDG